MSRSIERLLRRKMSNNDYDEDNNILIDDYAYEDEDIIDTIIEILNEELPIEYKSNKNLEKLECLIEELEDCVANADSINKAIVRKKINKLSFKIDRIICERKKYILDLEYELPILESYIEKLDSIIEVMDNKDNKKVELLRLLIDEKQMEHLEFTINKYPGFVNLRNKDEESLFRNIVNRYLESALILDEESLLFYSNLIAFLQNQRSFNLSNSEKKLCLEEMNKTLNSLSYSKKVAKKNKKEIYWINNLFTMIEPDLSKEKGKSKSNKLELDTIAEKYDIGTGFDSEIIKYVDDIEIPIVPENYSDRRLVDDYIITIDGKDALEIDDGISCEKLSNGNYLLGVHIASVLGYFDYDSEIVQEAINRVNTIYLPREVIPMFPFSFAGDIASLLPNENKLARSYYFEINKQGEIVNKRFEKTIIKSSKKTTYNEINKVLEEGTINDKLETLVNNLLDVSKILESRYKESILYQQIKSKKEDPTELKVGKFGSEKLVYYSMMIVGEEVAKFFAEKDYPCLYRTLEIDKKTSDNLERMINNVTKTYGGKVYDKLYQLISGIYPKAEYHKSGRHDGLDLDHYCHITSVLRRAADIVVEHALEICYDKVPTEEELIELEQEIDRVSSLINNKSKKIEWFSNEYKTLVRTRRN